MIPHDEQTFRRLGVGLPLTPGAQIIYDRLHWMNQRVALPLHTAMLIPVLGELFEATTTPNPPAAAAKSKKRA